MDMWKIKHAQMWIARACAAAALFSLFLTITCIVEADYLRAAINGGLFAINCLGCAINYRSAVARI